ncbi:CHAT domain-containing protein, partial [Deinococcus indicus]
MNRIPPVIFLAFANEQGNGRRYLRNIPEELRQVRETLESLKEKGVEVQYDSNATLETVLGAFRAYRDRVAVFHYGGHADSDSLLLEQAEGPAFEVDAAGLHPFLAHQGSLRLVFLNGCSTQEQAKALLEALQNGRPTALAETQLPAVIATSRAIQDAVARDFAVHFYQSLVSGASVQQAFDEAQGEVGTAQVNNPRKLYRPETKKPTDQCPWPWTLEGDQAAREWKLEDSLNAPTFGLPPLPPGPIPDDRPPGPFRGLQPFRREHAQVFFGRGREIRQLYEHVTDPNYPPVVLLYGQSGVGKSSVLDAGLLPRLERDYRVAYVRYDPALGALGTLNQALDKVAEAVDEPGGQKPVVVVLDQLDEAITRASSEQAARDDIKGLAEGLPGRLGPLGGNGPRVILGFRKEYLPEIETALAASSIERTKVFLQPLDAEGIVEAIVGPTQSKRLVARYGLSIEKGLPDRIAHDLEDRRNSPVGPTLQLLLTTMYEEASRKSTTTRHFDGALYQSLEQDYAHLEAFLKRQLATLEGDIPEGEGRDGPPISEAMQEAARLGLAVDVLEFHTTRLGTAQQRSPEELREQYAHQSAVLPDLIRSAKDLYLIVDAPGEDEKSRASTRLAHDTLGPLVQEQYRSSGRPGQRARRVLENRAADWKDDQTGALLDDQDLLLVEAGIAGMRALRNPEQKSTEEPNEESLLARSIQASQARKDRRDAEQRELNEAKNRAEEEREKALQSQIRSNRGLRARLWLALSFATVAAILGIFAVFAARQAAEQSRIATARQWVAQGQNIGGRRGQLGLLLLSSANKLYDTLETQSALFNAMQPLYGSPPLEQLIYKEDIISASFSLNSKYILTFSDRMARIATLRRFPSLEPIGQPIQDVREYEFSPDSLHLATRSSAGEFTLRRLSSLEPIGQPIQGVSGFEFSPDSPHLATWSSTGEFTLRRLSTLEPIGQPIQGVGGFEFSPDSLHLATWSSTGEFTLRRLPSLEPIGQPIQGINPDSLHLATRSVIDVFTLQRLPSLETIGRPIQGVGGFEFSPDSLHLATRSSAGEFTLRRLPSLEPIGKPIQGVDRFGFSPDSLHLATRSVIDEFTLRRLPSLEPIGQPIQDVREYEFSPDSLHLATRSSAGEFT